MNTAFKQALFYGVGIAVSKAMSLLMLPIITQSLSVKEYGSLEMLLVFTVFSTIIVGFGLSGALVRFVAYAKDKEETDRIVGNVITLICLVSVVSLVVLQICAHGILHYLPSSVSMLDLRLIIITLSFDGLLGIPLTWLRLNDRAGMYLTMTLSKELIQVGLIFIFLSYEYGITGIVAAGAITSVLYSCILIYMQQSYIKPCVDPCLFKRLFLYGMPLVVSGIATFCVLGLDKWLLAKHAGVEDLAVYAIALKFMMITSLIIQPYLLWWYPKRFIVLETVSGKEQTAYYSAVGVGIGFLCAYTVTIFGPLIIDYFLPPAYSEAKQYIPYLVAIVVVKNASELMNVGCYVNEDNRIQMYIQLVCSVLAILLYLILIPIFGIYAALAVLFLTFSIRLLLFYFYSQRIVHINYPLRNIFVILFVTVIFAYFCLLIPQGWERLMFSAVSCFLLMNLYIKLKLLPNIFRLLNLRIIRYGYQ